jgi:putative flippase GtrA
VTETIVLAYRETSDRPADPPSAPTPEKNDSNVGTSGRGRLFWQMPRFAVVGILNATLDLLVLNGLLWMFPTTATGRILLYTVIAYGVGAVNSFLLNKYWTFGHRQRPTWQELARFATTNLLGLLWNLALLWLASLVSHLFIANTVVWMNASKIFAISTAAFISFLGMRLWVFVKPSRRETTRKLPIIDFHCSEES